MRPALLVLLVGTAVLYLWGLGASGWANSFYSAAVQAGTESWQAFFFGSSDAGNSITVDKTPLALWPMVISARLFGLSSWSILVPQAIEGILSVGLLYATVRRWFGPVAALMSGMVLALTPVAVLMFRFNNPDAMLVLLLIAGAYACVRAVESGKTGWLLLVGSAVGFGFLAKMLQALLVVPAFALVYLIAAPTSFRRRLWQLILAGVAMVVSAGWYIGIVRVWPASDRPYIGGSQNNSILELALGYNGIGRITGGSYGGLGNTNQDAGILRLFSADMGPQISWLLPAALVLLIALFGISARAPRIDQTRAAAILWGGWLLVTGLVFSLSQGIIHGYYSVALAPAIAALVGIGTVTLWNKRGNFAARLILASTVAITTAWSFYLLSQSADWQPWLRYAVLITGIIATTALVIDQRLPRWLSSRAMSRLPMSRPMVRRCLLAIVVVVAIFAVAGGSAGYAVQTAATTHAGAIPSAGPNSGFGGRPGIRITGGKPPSGANGNQGAQRFAPPPGNTTRQPDGNSARQPDGTTGPRRGNARTGGPAGGQDGRTRVGGPGGMLDSATPPAALTALLTKSAGSYTWTAAAVRSNSAAGYQLATGLPVMAVGGFNGTDPSPTLARFQRYVAAGQIHYFIGDSAGTNGPMGGPGGRNGGGGGSDNATLITNWVAKNFTAQTVGGVTIYDLTKPVSA